MISNERPSPFGYPKNVRRRVAPLRPHGPEETIRTEKIQIERKTFVLALVDNFSGRCLRITEGDTGRHNTIIIPCAGLEEFSQLLDELVTTSAETPAPPA